MRASAVFLATALLAANASAQVHKCIDAAGKITFSDVLCPTTSKKAARVLGTDATDRRWENEAFGRERNMQSIENARQIIREPTSDALGDSGGGIIHSDPNERIRAQDERNMQRRLAEIEADRHQRERPQRAGPGRLVNCDAAGCWGAQNGVRYNRAAGGNLAGTDGSFCARGAGNTFSCN